MALLAQGADINWRNPDLWGSTALIVGSSEGKVEVVKALLVAGADHGIATIMKTFRVREFNGWTALIAASKKGRVEVVEALLAAGADRETKSEDGRSALDWARAEGKHGVVELLEAWDTISAARRTSTNADPTDPAVPAAAEDAAEDGASFEGSTPRANGGGKANGGKANGAGANGIKCNGGKRSKGRKARERAKGA